MFCYRKITPYELPISVQKIIVYALRELDKHRIGLVMECTPEQADYQRETRIKGLCRFGDDPFVWIVANDAETMVKSIFHEFQHANVHSHLVRIFKDKLKHPLAKKLFAETLEENAEKFENEKFEAFRKKYPNDLKEAQKESLTWMKKHKPNAYNDTQGSDGVLRESISLLQTITK